MADSGTCLDLRKQHNDKDVLSAFGKLVSGRSNYKTVEVMQLQQKLCSGCKNTLKGQEKFCPNCGTKVL